MEVLFNGNLNHGNMIAKMCKDATMMGNVWISVLLCLSLAAWQVEGKGTLC